MNVAGFGFDAEVAARVNRMPKVIGGTMPYITGRFGATKGPDGKPNATLATIQRFYYDTAASTKSARV